MYKHFFKRFFDFWISLTALLVLSPILIIITLWLTIANKGAGAFFTQERPGEDAKIFKVIKFKSMTDERDAEGKLLPDAQRLTKVGRFVRSTSIDELPQLINVLKGDMALIGPRPLTIYYPPLFNDFQRRRMEVRPGITGWAQVNGRNHCKLSKKFEYDVWYVDNISLLVDIKILWMTVVNVLKRSDIGEGSADMKDIDDLGFEEKIKELISIDKDKMELCDRITRKMSYDDCIKAKDTLVDFYMKNIASCSFLPSFTKEDAVNKINSLIEYVQRDMAFVFGCYIDGQLCAFLWAYEHYYREEKRIYISEIHVNKEYRSRGIGKSLLDAVEIEGRNLGYSAMYIHTEGDNKGALNLYEKNGYIIERYQLRKEI